MIRLRLAACLLPLAMVVAACAPRKAIWHGSPYNSPTEAPNFELMTTQGEHFELKDLQGHPALLFFGYTHCPDVCPPTLHTVAWLFDQLGNEADDLRFLFITVDPARDLPDILAAYLQAFDPRFIGLTGDQTALESIARSYGVAFFREAQVSEDQVDPGRDGYLVSHTSRLFLIGAEGLLLTNYSFGTAREEILVDLRQALELREDR